MALDEATIRRVRRETPACLERIHLNNAGASLMPAPVLETIQTHLELESQLGGYEASDARLEEIGRAYESVATLLGCTANNIAFVENATVAFAQALSSIPFRPGDKILTSNDDYISNQLMYLSLSRRLGIELVRAPDSPQGGIDLNATEDLIRREEPRLLALTHVPTNSGLVQPVREVGGLCKRYGVPFLLDACQSLGQIPLEVGRLGCDFLSATSRKFLRGPRGAGFLFVSDRVLDEGLEPLFIDMRGAEWVAPDLYRPAATASRFENWEFAYSLVLGTGAAARYALDLGVAEISQRASHLAALIRRRLDEAGLRVLDQGPELCAIVTVQVPGWEGPALQSALFERGINANVSVREYAVLDFDKKGVEWAMRISPHYYNTEGEIDRLIEVFQELVPARAGSA